MHIGAPMCNAGTHGALWLEECCCPENNILIVVYTHKHFDQVLACLGRFWG